MDKSEAIRLLGGSIPAAAKEVGASYQAVRKWPEVLPPRIADRVLAALYRRAHQQPEANAATAAPKAEATAP